MNQTEIKIDLISEEDFLNMKAEWDILLKESVTNELFLSWDWIHSWWEVYRDNKKKLNILAVRNNADRIVGIAPLYIQNGDFLGFDNRKILRFCSSVETFPDHLDFIYLKQYENEVYNAVFQYLMVNNKKWDVMIFNGLKDTSVLIKNLIDRKYKNFALNSQIISESVCPYLELSNNFTNYINTFSHKKRYNLRKKRRILLEKEGFILKILNSSDYYEEYLKLLFSLHAERIHRKGIKTTFSGEYVFNFHKKFVEKLSRKERVILAFLFKGSEPVGAIYCIKHNNKYYFYQSGLSAEGEKKGAGTVLMSLMIERAFEEGCKEFDFLRGSEEYKFYWTKNFRKNYNVIVRKNNTIGIFLYIIECIKKKLRFTKRFPSLLSQR